MYYYNLLYFIFRVYRIHELSLFCFLIIYKRPSKFALPPQATKAPRLRHRPVLYRLQRKQKHICFFVMRLKSDGVLSHRATMKGNEQHKTIF